MDQKYSTPEDTRIYAIGDVHGYVDLLEKMHEAISMDLLREPPVNAHIVYLGDYIDRGPDSRGVIECLIGRRDRGDGIDKSFIRGNHEDGMMEFMREPLHANWLKWGGVQTLASYGITFEGEVPLPGEKERAAEVMRTVIPAAHFDFFEMLELSQEIGDYFFAHAGVDPFKSFGDQTHKDLTRMRQPFLSWHKDPLYAPFSKRVVHGHTISSGPIERPHRIGVDTGAYDGGGLSAVVLERDEVRFLSVE